MTQQHSAGLQPTSSQSELLGLLLDQMLERGAGAPYFKFRSANFARVRELEDLEAEGWLKRIGDEYFVLSNVVALINTEAAQSLQAIFECIYSVLRGQYRLTQQDPIKVVYLASTTKLPAESVLRALHFMMDTTLWHIGGALGLPIEEAWISPSERLLKFENYAALCSEVRSWHRRPAIFPGAGSESDLPAIPLQATETPARPSMPVIRAWGPARACLQEFFRFDEIKEVAALAGFDVTAASHLVQAPPTKSTKGHLLTAIDAQLRDMSHQEKSHFLTALMEEILRRSPETEEKLADYLNRLGWTFIGSKLLPVALFDADALDDMPAHAHPDLLKAAHRLRNGDLGGAISAAAGAVDAAVSKVYLEQQLGDPTHTSFQERCKHALAVRGVLPDLEGKLTELGWEAKDTVPFKKNLERALTQGAYVMQTLRSNMGDVHGSKPILRALVFDSIRWAELLVGALVVKADDQSKD